MSKLTDNLKISLTVMIFLAVLVGLVAWSVFHTIDFDSNLPDSLKLKADKSKILSSKDIGGGIIKYDYVSPNAVVQDALAQAKDELIAEIKNSTSTIELTEVYDRPKEDVTKRTVNSKQYKIALTEDGREIWKAKVYGGSPFYKEDDGWYQVETATTTKVAFDSQMQPNVADRLKMFFGKKVYAAAVYSSTADGFVYRYGGSGESWSSVQGAASGTAVYYTDESSGYGISAECAYSVPSNIYIVFRSFFYYDLTSFSSATVLSASENLMGRSYVYGSLNSVSSQHGTQSDTLGLGDFDAFSGTAYGTVSGWSASQYNIIVYNSTGISDIQAALGGIFKTAVREYEHDYLNSSPGPSSAYYDGGVRYAETSGTDQDPYLNINIITYPQEFAFKGKFNLSGKFDFATSGPALVTHGSEVFTYTGSNQTFTVPAGVTSVDIKVWGAGGGGYGSGWGSDITGGGGGYAGATITVTPGENLTVMVGGYGVPYPNYSAYGGGGKGYGSQSSPGCDCGGSGGGRSEISRSDTPLLVAAAGGGGGANTGGCGLGGAGGGTTGERPSGNAACTAETPGDQSSYSPTGGDSTSDYGGGGGAGYKGGSGGAGPISGSYGDGGAGGSSYTTGSNITNISGAGQTPGNSADPDRAGAGTGGDHGGNGSNGRVIISW